MIEMRTEGPSDPRYVLLKRLVAAQQSLTNVQEALLMVRTWNALRKGEPLYRLQLVSASGPVVFPEPV